MIAFAPILGDVAHELGISLPVAQSSLLGVFTFVVAISALTFGALADRFGIVPVLLFGGVLSFAPNLLFPLVGSHLGLVVVLRIAQGFGAGTAFTLIPLCAHNWFLEREKGRVAGIGMTMINAGFMLGVCLSPIVNQHTGAWRITMGWFGIVEVFLFLYVVFVAWAYKQHAPARALPSHSVIEESGRSEMKAALLSPAMYIGIVMCMSISWLLNVLNVLTPQYFALAAPVGVGFGPITAGKLMLVVQAGTVLGGLVAGFVMDKVFKGNPKPVWLAGFLLTPVTVYGILFPWVYRNPPILIASLFIAGLAVAFLNPAAAVYTTLAYPQGIVGRVAGIWLGIGAFGGALGIFTSAFVLQETGTYQLSILVFAITAVMGGVLSQTLKKGGPTHHQMTTNIGTTEGQGSNHNQTGGHRAQQTGETIGA